MKFITFGVESSGKQGVRVACRIIDARNEAAAIAIAEGAGNRSGTTIAYTDESLVELAGEDADYVEDDL